MEAAEPVRDICWTEAEHFLDAHTLARFGEGPELEYRVDAEYAAGEDV